MKRINREDAKTRRRSRAISFFLVFSWRLRVFAVISLLSFVHATIAADVVISLKLDSGGVADGRDTRTFAVPITINGKEQTFAWGCAGWTLVSESFAKENTLKITKGPDDLATYVDAAGKPMFAGVSDVAVKFGGKQIGVQLKVLKDAYATGNTIGYEIANQFQWELNPDATNPTLTLRPPGTKIAGSPIAVLPLTDDGERLWLSVTVRNVPFDLVVMPQASDIIAGPSIQKRWDLTKGKVEDVPSPAGPVRTAKLSEKEPIQLAKKVTEKNVAIVLVGDPDSGQDLPANTNAIGASILNRYLYVVDANTKQMTLLARIPTTQPTKDK